MAVHAAQLGDFTYESSGTEMTMTGYTGSGGDVVIPDSIAGLPITGIGNFALMDCASLVSITIPDSVTSIGTHAFGGCSNLTSVVIPNGVSSIENGAFSACSTLTSIVIPTGVTFIGEWAFDGCHSLAKITVPDGVIRIAQAAFRDCTSLTSIIIPDSVLTIEGRVSLGGGGAFEGCSSLTTVYFYGDAPTMSGDGFGNTMATLFYKPGTTGWEATIAGRPTLQWNGIFGAQSLELLAGLTIIGTDRTRPVEYVSWGDATEYCTRLTERERLAGRITPNAVYRLSTEAEWEYACRAGTSTRFSFGDDPGYVNLMNYAWCGDNSDWQTHPVGQKLPNAWGLHDMHGNVWEHCQDGIGSYPGEITLDPQYPRPGYFRVARGGHWGSAGGCRSACRVVSHEPAGWYQGYIGFRVVSAPGQP